MTKPTSKYNKRTKCDLKSQLFILKMKLLQERMYIFNIITIILQLPITYVV